jgi:geranylgeranyl diphosphate synthase, type I
MAATPFSVRRDQSRSLTHLAEIAQRTDGDLGALLDAEIARWGSVDEALVPPLSTLRELVLHGGKRLRPAFCQWGFDAVGGDASDGDARDGRVQADLADVCCALELLHAFALAHDDIMDDSASRRGIPTTHVQWSDRHVDQRWKGESRRFGEAVAILVGDLAHTVANRLVAGKSAAVVSVWGELETELMLGQFLDVVGTAAGGVSESTARHVAQLKSGRYTVARPLELGVALAGMTSAPQALRDYGESVGLAFQLRDDVLGVFGTEEATGKPVGDDLREGKPTAMLAVARDRATPSQLAVLDGVGNVSDDDDVAMIQDVLEATHARHEIEALIDSLTTAGIEALGRSDTDLDPDTVTLLAEFAAILATRSS